MDTSRSLTPVIPSMAGLAHHADRAAEQTTLARYQARKAAHTLRRQAADIALFETFLNEVDTASQLHHGELAVHMAHDLAAWSGVSHGLVEAWLLWQLSQGYAIGSINVRLATVKTYASLAFTARYLSSEAYSLIRTVKAFRQAEGRNQDDKRTETRRPLSKKAEPTMLNSDQAARLKSEHKDTAKGHRDKLLMCLLIEHGLRCGEIAALDVSDIDPAAGTLTFYRHKVDMVQTLQLESNSLLAALAYLKQGPQEGPLFTSSLRSAEKVRIDERTICARVASLGRKIGLEKLSPHDLRHYWAMDAMRNGTSVDRLQDAGGWSSPAMPLHYAKASGIANRGVKITV